jgi:hypothetical protein
MGRAMTDICRLMNALIEVDRRLTVIRKELNGSLRIPAQLLRWLVAEVHGEAEAQKSAPPSRGDHNR